MRNALILSFLVCLAVHARSSFAAQDYQAIVLYSPGSPAGWTSVFHEYPGTAGECGGGGLGPATNNRQHALLTSPQHPDGIDFNPFGGRSSYMWSSHSGFQAGDAILNSSPSTGRAFYWHGTRESAIDLHPDGYAHSGASYATAVEQVGVANVPNGAQHAMMWRGSPSSAVDLHPLGFTHSVARATDGAHQEGNGTFGSTNRNHALLWSGGAASVIDLHPIGYSSSIAFGVSGDQQVGSAESDAMLWFGSAASAVNLGEGFSPNCQALGTNGSIQVGWAAIDNGPQQAVAWFGSAASRRDLYQLLPAGFGSSTATAVDVDGNVYGAARDANGINHVILWKAVPEPNALPAMVLLGAAALQRRATRLG